MGAIITGGGGGGGGALTDHQHTASGDGGDTIAAQTVLGVVRLSSGDDGFTPGELRLYDGVAVGRYASLAPYAGGMSATRILAMPDINGQMFVVGNGANPATLAGTISLVNMVGQTGNIASRIMAKTVPAGMYMVNIYMECSSAGAGGSTVVLTITYTDSVGGKTANITLVSDATSNKQNTTLPIYIASAGDVTWATVRTGGTYTVRMRTSFLGS